MRHPGIFQPSVNGDFKFMGDIHHPLDESIFHYLDKVLATNYFF